MSLSSVYVFSVLQKLLLFEGTKTNRQTTDHAQGSFLMSFY